jgi:hypothetical protein
MRQVARALADRRTPALEQAHAALASAFTAIQGADARPTAAMEARAADALKQAEAALSGKN